MDLPTLLFCLAVALLLALIVWLNIKTYRHYAMLSKEERKRLKEDLHEPGDWGGNNKYKSL